MSAGGGSRAEHLGDSVVLDFVEGRVSTAARASAEAHIDVCPACRELVAVLAEAHAASESSRAASDDDGRGGDGPAETRITVPAPGDLFAERFELGEEVGSGAMGTVYRARDLVRDVTVAVKVVHLGRSEERGRFEREARVLASLTHRSIVSYVAHGLTPAGDGYLAMEWLEGSDLAARLRHGRLSVDETTALLRPLTEALAAAHARGIVHRDLKPHNVFLPGGEVAAAKLIDFGIARAAHVSSLVTRRGALVGTPGYMAPEQARGQGALDARVDVFSLGCVAYECLTGAPPFLGETLLETLGKLLADTPRPVREVAPEVPAALGDLVMRMLSKKASARPADGAALATELARMDGRRARSRKMAPVALWIAVALVSLASVLVVVRVAQRRLTASAEHETGEPREPRPGQTTDAGAAPAAAPPLIFVLGIDNRTVDSHLDGLPSFLFASAIDSSSKLSIFSGVELRKRVARVDTGGEPLDDALARKVAESEHRRVVTVRGAVSSRARGFAVHVEGRDVVSGKVLLTNDDTPASADELVKSLARSACSLRAAIGDHGTCTPRFSSSLEANEEIMQGTALYREGQYVASLKHAERALAFDPTAMRASFLQAYLLVALGRRAEAARELDKLLATPDAVSPRNRSDLQALELTQREDYEPQILLLQEKLAAGEDRKTVLGTMATVYGRMERWPEAVALNRELVAANPKDVVAQDHLFLSELGNGEIAQVRDDARLARDDMAAEPPLADFFIVVSSALLGDVVGTDEAMADFERKQPLIAIPSEADVALWRYASSPRPATAAADLAALTTRIEARLAAPSPDEDPEDRAAALLLLAEIKRTLGDRSGALAAVDAMPPVQNEHLLFLRGTAYAAMQQAEKASAIITLLDGFPPPSPVARLSARCVAAEVAAARHDRTTELAEANAAVAARDTWASRYIRGRASWDSGHVADARRDLEWCDAHPEGAAQEFGDVVSELRRLAVVRDLLASVRSQVVSQE